MRRAFMALLAVSLFAIPAAADVQAAERAGHMMAQDYYVREPEDRPWQIKITGRVSSLAGIYFVVIGPGPKIFRQEYVPCGQYPPESPCLMKFPADQVAGDYKFVIFGQQDDLLGLDLPLTDLPFEVYSGSWLSLGNDPKTLVAFKAPPEATKIAVKAYVEHLQVYDENMKLVADSKTGLSLMPPDDKKTFYIKRDHPLEFEAQPGRLFWMRSLTMYFNTREKLYFAFDPARLFEPDSSLDKTPWWNLVQ